MDRLDIMHTLTKVTLGGKLNLAPIMKNPRRILDIGTGTGIWAIEMGMSINWEPHNRHRCANDLYAWDRRQIS